MFSFVSMIPDRYRIEEITILQAAFDDATDLLNLDISEHEARLDVADSLLQAARFNGVKSADLVHDTVLLYQMQSNLAD